MKRVTISDAPAFLNTNDKAFWVTGWNECAALAEAAHSLPDGMVRFCPECGMVGEPRSGARDCCPDGSHAAYMPEKTADLCRALFIDALAASPAQPVQPTRALTTRELADVTCPWADVWTDKSFGIANAAIAKFCEVNGIAAPAQPKD